MPENVDTVFKELADNAIDGLMAFRTVYNDRREIQGQSAAQQHGTSQHITAQHSTAQHSTAAAVLVHVPVMQREL